MKRKPRPYTKRPGVHYGRPATPKATDTADVCHPDEVAALCGGKEVK
jgi:hypothetical protein